MHIINNIGSIHVILRRIRVVFYLGSYFSQIGKVGFVATMLFLNTRV